MKVTFRSALVTGASSGIGRALALALAGPDTRLHLSGRVASRLESCAAACRDQGAVVDARVIDACDRDAMTAWIAAAGPLDLVIANAGIAPGNRAGQAETAAQARAVLATNLDGALNTVLPALALMAGQPPGPDGWRGRIAVIASLAAFVPAPGAASYCASKAAIDTWMVATAPSARRAGVALTSVCPGYVRTPMTARYPRPMPGLMDADEAARRALAGIRAARVRVLFPWWMGLAARLAGLLPPALIGRLAADHPRIGERAAP